jgi:hypothetical protein
VTGAKPPEIDLEPSAAPWLQQFPQLEWSFFGVQSSKLEWFCGVHFLQSVQSSWAARRAVRPVAKEAAAWLTASHSREPCMREGSDSCQSRGQTAGSQQLI